MLVGLWARGVKPSEITSWFAPSEPGVGLGIGVCCLALENSAPGIYIHSLALGSVAKMDGRLRSELASCTLSISISISSQSCV